MMSHPLLEIRSGRTEGMYVFGIYPIGIPLCLSAARSGLVIAARFSAAGKRKPMLDGCFRLSVGTIEQMSRFVDAFRSVRAELTAG